MFKLTGVFKGFVVSSYKNQQGETVEKKTAIFLVPDRFDERNDNYYEVALYTKAVAEAFERDATAEKLYTIEGYVSGRKYQKDGEDKVSYFTTLNLRSFKEVGRN